MTLTETETALRLLGAIYLLLPLIAILLQTMVNFYAREGSDLSSVRQTTSLYIAVTGFAVLAASGLLLVIVLNSSELNVLLKGAAWLSLIGLVIFGIALGLLGRDVLSEVEG